MIKGSRTRDLEPIMLDRVPIIFYTTDPKNKIYMMWYDITAKLAA